MLIHDHCHVRSFSFVCGEPGNKATEALFLLFLLSVHTGRTWGEPGNKATEALFLHTNCNDKQYNYIVYTLNTM